MYARVITFHLDGITPSEFQAHAVEVAPVFTTWPGLLAKVWIADEDANTYGGIYLFADRASADRSRDTDLFKGIVGNPGFADVSVREFDALDEPTAITAAVFADAHAV
ncbi:MAG TPA: YdhR family protein [Acidimicrobiia bacterium]|jgi:hypothetical protein|nr:YdhR family protein [Acidimicrobiia bacterium]